MKAIKPNFNINRFNFAIPLMAISGIAALSVNFINYNPEDFASAATSELISSSITYGDYYVALSPNSTIDLDLQPDNDGAYAYATDNVTVTTNAPGYDLSISSADTDDASLKLNGTETTTGKVISPSSATGGTTGTTATLAANTYGYALPSATIGNDNFDTSYDNPTAASKWAGVPTAGSTIRSTSAATASTGDDVAVHYGVHVDNDIAAGEYSGTVVYTVVANTPAEQTATISPISSTAGAAQTVTVTSGPAVATGTTLAASDVSITLGTTACTVTNVDTSSGHLVTTCTVPSTLAAGTYTVNISVPRYNNYTASISGGYTVITPTLKQATSAANITTMQGMTSAVCDKAGTWASGETDLTLTDSRDSSTYAIRKLADGHCWMVQNLRIMGKTLTTSDSDVSARFAIPSVNSSSWCTADTSACENDIKVYYDNNTTYGAYYNWYTATAGSGTYSTGYSSVNYSICPKGWKLPYGTTGDFSWYYLYNTGYGASVARFQAATNTGSSYWAGYYNGSLSLTGSTGYWWSRTSNHAYSAYYLRTYKSTVDSQNVTHKYDGFSVRCVLSSS